jgi:hypothetical protein
MLCSTFHLRAEKMKILQMCVRERLDAYTSFSEQFIDNVVSNLSPYHAAIVKREMSREFEDWQASPIPRRLLHAGETCRAAILGDMFDKRSYVRERVLAAVRTSKCISQDCNRTFWNFGRAPERIERALDRKVQAV